MKSLVIVVTGLAVVTSLVPEDIWIKWNKEISGYQDKCLQESGADMQDVLDIDRYLTTGDHNDAVKCFYKCIFNSAEVFDSNGQLSDEKYTQKFPWVPLASASKCKLDKVDDDKCEKSYSICKCIVNELDVK